MRGEGLMIGFIVSLTTGEKGALVSIGIRASVERKEGLVVTREIPKDGREVGEVVKIGLAKVVGVNVIATSGFCVFFVGCYCFPSSAMRQQHED